MGRKYYNLILCACIFSGLFLSQPIKAQEINAGRIQYIRCAADTTLYYSIFLPKTYHTDSTYPLLLFLDPAARGNVPVEKYQSVAEAENVIIAGSFDSKNFDAAASLKSIPAILSDVRQKFLVNKSAIWLCGFSGGSRMAAAYAAAYEGITGVIACGAGFAKDVLPEGNEFHTMHKDIPYAGIAGDKDMNFEEMVGIADLLSKRGKKNLLLVFDGGHIWPPALQLQLAINWLRMNAGLLSAHKGNSKNGVIIEQYQQYRDANLLYFAWLIADQAKQVPLTAAVGDSLTGTSLQSKHFNRDKAMFETVLEEEQRYMDQFSFLYDQFISSEQIQATNDELWKQKAAVIAQLKKDKNPYRQLSGQRLHDICWRLCAEQYSWLMENSRFRQAYSSAYILSFLAVTGTNPDYLMARAAAGMGDKDLCYTHLKKALKKGNLRKDSLQNDKYLRRVLEEKVLQKLVNE